MKFWIVIFLVLPAIALANTATVRSGEHGGFTRFVVAMQEASSFSSASGAGEIRITIPGIAAVRLDQAFDRVERERVTDIAFAGGVLRFTKDCACTERVYGIGTNLIVVDVFDPGIEPDTSTEETEPGPPAQAAPDPRPLSDVLPVVLPARQERMALEPFAAQAPGARPKDREAAAAGAVTARQAEAELAQDIGIALTQGVLTFDLENAARKRPGETQRRQEPDLTGVAGGLAGPALEARDGLANLRTSGPIDGLLRGEGGLRLSGISLDCSAAGNYALVDWMPDTPFSEVVPRLRRQLVLEFDAVDPDIALDLARAYAAFGFGAEAISILDLASDASPPFEAVRNIANVVEYGSALNEPMPISQLECPGAMSFWTALSLDRLPRDVMFDEDAAIRELNALPKHLRAVLAPELSKRLRERGSVEKASLIMRNAARTEDNLSTKAQIETNELLADDARSDAQEAPLYSMLADGAAEAPIALISFIKKQVRNGREISPETALLAESYALQFRGTEIETDLIAAHMIALAQSGQFRQAIQLLRASPLPNETYNDSIADLFQTLTRYADDVTFLKYALLPVDEEQMAVDEDIRLKLAERALDLGFDKVAERLLGTIVKRKTARSYERLMGELMLRRGMYDLAVAFLERSDAGEMTAERAEAFFESGQYALAAQAFESLGDEGRRYEAAFRSPDVRMPSTNDTASLEALRRLQTARAPRGEDSGAPDSLSRARDLIGASASVVSDTRLLLSATEF